MLNPNNWRYLRTDQPPKGFEKMFGKKSDTESKSTTGLITFCLICDENLRLLSEKPASATADEKKSSESSGSSETKSDPKSKSSDGAKEKSSESGMPPWFGCVCWDIKHV
jgi:hypothetical protein